jgi:hypothetical protein
VYAGVPPAAFPVTEPSEEPLQLAFTTEEKLTVRAAGSLIETVELFTHPFASVPVTVYMPVQSVPTVDPIMPPGAHVYVVAPVADAEPLQSPKQVASLPLALIVGSAFTVTVVVPLLWQPFASIPSTVYVVVVEGFANTDGPD